MNIQPESNNNYQLNGKYRLNKISGKNCSVMLRNNNDEIQAVIDVCNDKVSRIGGFSGGRITKDRRSELVSFIKENKLSVTGSGARDLGVSVYRPEKGDEEYLTAAELSEKLKGDISNAHVTVYNYKKNRMDIKDKTKGAMLNLSKAAVKKLVIGENCNLIVDLRDNPYITSLVVKSGFTGNINLSRTGVKKVEILDNCRCELSINDSLKCFNLSIGDVFSGVLTIRNACFHKLNIGYYSYAEINLASNWGRRSVNIGNSFRGKLNIDNVHAPSVRIGNDCKGSIRVSSKDDSKVLPKIEIADEFGGKIDLSASKNVMRLECGKNTGGKINSQGCPSLKVVRLDEHFHGKADFSESAIEYLRVGKDCQGELILLGCENLALLKMSNEQRKSVTIDRAPLKVRTKGKEVYYSFYERELPKEYFTPFYQDWYNETKRIFKEKIMG